MTDQFILNQELAERVGGVSGLLGVAVMMFGPTLILTGSEEQKREHLPKILSDEFQWCQGWSEPSAGSGLASLQTRATRDGDDFAIRGRCGRRRPARRPPRSAASSVSASRPSTAARSGSASWE